MSLPVEVFEQTRSTAAASVLLIVSVLPAALFRIDRRRRRQD
jgi:hypothetical protein